MVMITDGRFKMIDAPGFRPMLYDLLSDPQELSDIGADPAQAGEISRLRAAILDWYRAAHNRITVPDEWFTEHDALLAAGGDPTLYSGIIIGYWDEEELQRAQDLAARYAVDLLPHPISS